MSTCLCSLSAFVLRLKLSAAPPTYRQVRWRMRRWAPINESKLYYVRPERKFDPVEYHELLKVFPLYKTYMKSIKFHLREQLFRPQTATELQTDKAEHEYLQALKLENQQWNENTKLVREARQTKEEEERIEKQFEELAEVERSQKQLREVGKRLVEHEQALVHQFIDPDNLEAEIESSLNTRTSYNYVLDSEGNVYKEQPDGTLEVGELPVRASDEQVKEQLVQQKKEHLVRRPVEKRPPKGKVTRWGDRKAEYSVPH